MMPYGIFRHPLFYLLVLSFLPLPKLKPPNFNFQITWILVIISLLPATSQHPFLLAGFMQLLKVIYSHLQFWNQGLIDQTENMRCLPFWVQVISFETIFFAPSFNLNFYDSIIFTAEQYSVVYIQTKFLLPINQLKFYFLTIVNRVKINMPKQVFLEQDIESFGNRQNNSIIGSNG